MKKTLLLLLFGLFLSNQLLAQVLSPAEFLGYELGEQWTPHYKVMDYFKHVAEESNMVTFKEYGKAYEGRELIQVVVTSARNQDNIDEIRQNNLKMVGFLSGELTPNQKAIVWLSYNVHGNETSSSEAAMNTIYRLITEKKAWLDNTVVIMDPMVNPDGRDRYVYWNKMATGAVNDPDPVAREHNEPWPGGRTNHYYFDLNRDWAWQTQTESQQRIQEYLHWMPHVHVDFHEQGINSPYYFAPAAEPFHYAITDWQRELQTMIGKNHAKYFDRNNWMYFTREIFDLFYPSYGDTWPTFNGAVGMTYEQAGHSRSGLGVETAEGDTLTLLDRLTHHTTTGLSTVETASRNHDKVINEFSKYFSDVQSKGSGSYKTFIVSKKSNPDKVAMLMRYLLDQNIVVRAAASRVNANGFDYSTGKTGRITIEEGDYVISTYQPQGNLVRVLFEPSPELSDSLTYDITSWEAHYAYGLEGYAISGRVEVKGIGLEVEDEMPQVIDRPYAYLAKWNSMDDLKFLASIMRAGVNVRYAEKAFSMNGEKYEPGTLIITRNGNEKLGRKFDSIVKDAAALHNRLLTPVSTGFVTSGKDFGSSSVHFVKPPRVALITGDGTYRNMVGHIWHFFDQQIEYPVTQINKDDLGNANWDDFDVVLMPSGSYGDVFDDNGLSELRSWIRGGGTLIALEGANNFLAGKEGFSLSRKSRTSDESDDPEDKLRKFGDAERAYASNMNAGSIYELTMDPTHPLAFGYSDTYMSLKLGSSAFEYLDNGWNVGVAKSGVPRSGFVGKNVQEQLEQSLSFGVQNMGRGAVVYMIDNPFFRGFWHNGKLLIGNAVFFVGN